MNIDNQGARVLAFELLSGRFGFAVLEGMRLIDAGARSYSRADYGKSFATLSSLFDFFRPEAIAIADEGNWQAQRLSGARSTVKLVEHETNLRSLPLHRIKKSEMVAALPRVHRGTRYEIAAAVALIFPELAWKVPPQRKPWQTAHRNQVLFEAIALGIACSLRLRDHPIIEECDQNGAAA